MRAKTINYQMAMYILRNPYDAILSNFNLARTRSKVGFAKRDMFQSKIWPQSVRKQLVEWKRMTLYWLTEFKRPLHVIVYEYLRKVTANELFKVGRFLHLNNLYIDLYCAKNCLKPKYHRDKPEWMTASILFDNNMKRSVNSAINDVKKELNDREYIIEALRKYIMVPNTVVE